MNLIDEILIILDENKELNLDEVCQRLRRAKKQIISSTLGRLYAKGFVKKNLKTKTTLYSLSNAGHLYLYGLLDSIKNTKSKKLHDNWSLLLFDIPELKRKLRDDLRKFLLKNGYGRLQSSVWVSYWDKSENINEFAKLKELTKNITQLSIKLAPESEKQFVASIHWDWDSINNNYKKFIELAAKFAKGKNKTTFQAKTLVINFARALQFDPKLPAKMQPKTALTDKAIEMYQKIRSSCYK